MTILKALKDKHSKATMTNIKVLNETEIRNRQESIHFLRGIDPLPTGGRPPSYGGDDPLLRVGDPLPTGGVTPSYGSRTHFLRVDNRLPTGGGPPSYGGGDPFLRVYDPLLRGVDPPPTGP
jgi:hypothetical protein